MESDTNFDNFTTAKKMIPEPMLQEVIDKRKCYNHKKGCTFQTKWYLCSCCMMLKAIGQDFFDLEKRLIEEEGRDVDFQMKPWQLKEYIDKKDYWQQWCDNYPRGATE